MQTPRGTFSLFLSLSAGCTRAKNGEAGQPPGLGSGLARSTRVGPASLEATAETIRGVEAIRSAEAGGKIIIGVCKAQVGHVVQCLAALHAPAFESLASVPPTRHLRV